MRRPPSTRAFPLLLLAMAAPVRAVTPVPIGALLQHNAHYFDLDHQRLRFTPRGAAGYRVKVAPFRGTIDQGAAVGKPDDPQHPNWRTPLPFPFPFAGKKWDEVYINLNGNLTFGAPERTPNSTPETWADGTMRWLASAFESHAIAGERWAIVPFWGLNSPESTHIFTQSTRAAFTVTWRAIRYQAPNEGYEPLGESIFQVRLARDGAIEFRYGGIAEKDGIAGVFPGAAPAGKVLDRVDLPPAPSLAPELDIRHAELEDRGADLHFSLTLAGDLPAKAAGRISYHLIAASNGEAYAALLNLDSNGRTPADVCLVLNPHGNTIPTDCSAKFIVLSSRRGVDFYLPKIALKDPARVEWRAEIAVDDKAPAVSTGKMRPVSLAVPMPSGFDFNHAVRETAGSLYEIFYYPFVPKSRPGAFQEIYRHAPAEDDLAVALTDFRIDDIHDHGASNSAEDNERIELYNSPILQQAAGPVYLGPRFRETVKADDRTFHNYAFAVGWIAHEMTHHWVATLQWKPPDVFALLDVQHVHWNDFLATPATTPVWPLFSDTPYPEESNMGGMAVETLPGGHGHSVTAPWGVASGLCALDLYQMGLMSPEEVPKTFFISGAKPAENGGATGGEAVPVRIVDIVAANGPRVPAAKDAQHRFHFQIYLLHEDGREPDPQKLAQAQAIEAMVARYFALATGGRMTVVPTR